MAREIQHFTVTIPKATPKATPQVAAMNMPTRIVEEVEIVVPPGPRGEVGFQLGAAGNQLIPVTSGQFLVTDDEVIRWAVEGQIESGAWQLIGYNTGAFDHTIEVRFLCQLPGGQTDQPGFQPLPADSLAG